MVYVGETIIYTWHYVSGLEDGDTVDIINGTPAYLVDGGAAIVVSHVTIDGAEITVSGLIAEGYRVIFEPGELIVLDRATPTPAPTATPRPEPGVDAPKTGDIDTIVIALSGMASALGITILLKYKKKKTRN